MNSLAVAISIILLPGLIACVICDKITVHTPKWDAFKYSIYSFLFGVLSYGLLQLICYFVYKLFTITSENRLIEFIWLDVWTIIQNDKSKISLLEVLNATLLSPIVAIIASYMVNHKVINNIAKHMRVSQKYGDENLFSFFLNAKEIDWVYIRDINTKLIYFGRVVSHSECDHIQEVVLSEVTVCDYETSDELYNVPIIYLSRPLGVFTIEAPESVVTPVQIKEDANGEKTT